MDVDRPTNGELLRREHRARMDQLRRQLAGKSFEDLVRYCRERIRDTENLGVPSFNIVQIIRRSLETKKDINLWIEMASEQWSVQHSLERIVREALNNDENIPEAVKDYVLKVKLGVLPTLRKPKTSKNDARDHEIWQCVRDLAECTELNAQRNPASDKNTAISVVARAIHLEYQTVEEIYKRRQSRRLKQID